MARLAARLRAWLHRTPGVTYADLQGDLAPFFADYRPDGTELDRLNEPAADRTYCAVQAARRTALPHQTRQGD